jgi:hypothetical protein
LYTFWKTHLQPRGYKLRSQIVTWPGGMPGEIGLRFVDHFFCEVAKRKYLAKSAGP